FLQQLPVSLPNPQTRVVRNLELRHALEGSLQVLKLVQDLSKAQRSSQLVEFDPYLFKRKGHAGRGHAQENERVTAGQGPEHQQPLANASQNADQQSHGRDATHCGGSDSGPPNNLLALFLVQRQERPGQPVDVLVDLLYGRKEIDDDL